VIIDQTIEVSPIRIMQFEQQNLTIAKMVADYSTLTVATDGYKAVRVARIFVKNARCAIETLRKELKEESLTRGRQIDFEAKRLTEIIEKVEATLAAEEQAEDERKELIAKEAADKKEAVVKAEKDRLEAIVKAEDARKAAILKEEYDKKEALLKAQFEAAKALKLEKDRLLHDRVSRLSKAGVFTKDLLVVAEMTCADFDTYFINESQRVAKEKLKAENEEKERISEQAKLKEIMRKLELTRLEDKKLFDAEIEKQREISAYNKQVEDDRQLVIEKQLRELKEKEACRLAAEKETKLEAQKILAREIERTRLEAVQPEMDKLELVIEAIYLTAKTKLAELADPLWAVNLFLCLSAVAKEMRETVQK